MACQFAGCFARPTVPRPRVLPEGAVWRNITSPFVGVGVRLPTTIDPAALSNPDKVQALARSLGVFGADRWIFLRYVCWGGDIDFVHGLGSRDGVTFGPVEESDLDKVKAAYTGLMENFGISEVDALRFEPFKRGFWGDD